MLGMLLLNELDPGIMTAPFRLSPNPDQRHEHKFLQENFKQLLQIFKIKYRSIHL